MKEIYKAIDDAYSLLDKCIDKLLKGRITKDEKLEQEAYCDMEYAVNGTMQNLSYLEGRLKGKTLSEWIKVEDRLPEREEGYIASKVVLVRHCDGSYNIAFFSYRENDNCWFNPMRCMLKNVTHWMPIVPPKED